MHFLRRLSSRITALFRRGMLDAEMDDEMSVHVEMQTQENVTKGMSPEEARYAALQQFGHAAGIREACREQREGFVSRQLSLVWRDVRVTFRQLLKSPGFTAVAVLTLALAPGRRGNADERVETSSKSRESNALRCLP